MRGRPLRLAVNAVGPKQHREEANGAQRYRQHPKQYDPKANLPAPPKPPGWRVDAANRSPKQIPLCQLMSGRCVHVLVPWCSNLQSRT